MRGECVCACVCLLVGVQGARQGWGREKERLQSIARTAMSRESWVLLADGGGDGCPAFDGLQCSQWMQWML